MALSVRMRNAPAAMMSLAAIVALTAIAACDDAPVIAGGSQCLSSVLLTPTSVSLAVGDTTRVAITVVGGCPVPTVRDETPSVVQVDVLSPGLFRVTGLAIGDGRVRVLSGVDTTVSSVVGVSVVGR